MSTQILLFLVLRISILSDLLSEVFISVGYFSRSSARK